MFNRDELFRLRVLRIEREHQQDMNRIKREGARLRAWLCPIMAALFLASVVFNLLYKQAMFPIVIGSIVAAAFLAMLVFGWLFDRPKED